MLERAGPIRREKDAQWRRCHLDADPLRDAAAWAEQYRRFWDDQFGSLAALSEQEGEDDAR